MMNRHRKTVLSSLMLKVNQKHTAIRTNTGHTCVLTNTLTGTDNWEPAALSQNQQRQHWWTLPMQILLQTGRHHDYAFQDTFFFWPNITREGNSIMHCDKLDKIFPSKMTDKPREMSNIQKNWKWKCKSKNFDLVWFIQFKNHTIFLNDNTCSFFKLTLINVYQDFNFE